jgi:hypothetical protein
MPGMGLEPTIPEFEWAKTVHGSDSEVTAIGINKQTTNSKV